MSKQTNNRSSMIVKVLSVLITYHLSLVTLSAQTTFTQRIQQKSKAGEGKVTVTHDKAIDELVNGPNAQTAQAAQTLQSTSSAQKQASKDATGDKTTTPKTDSEKAREQLRRITEQTTDTTDTPVIDTRRKVMRGGYKINGYRVQAFAGGNQRKDRQRAEQVGNTIKASYPEEPVYVHFYSPRWICRVGNYRTYEEAHQMLMNIRKLGITGASIVKGKITVQY